jgi:hypothetical protein
MKNMKKGFFVKLSLVILMLISSSILLNAQVKILFDATKAETAGNADWVIDSDVFDLGFNNGPAVVGQGNEANPQRIPNPLQSTITSTTAETYWKGGLSYWGIDCVKKGYTVETLPYNGVISYGNSANNSQDLSNYKIYVVVEPNILFTAAEKTAIMLFVKNGGSLFIVSDHTISDRNNDGHDSPEILNDLINNNSVQNNPFGFTFDLANVSGSSSNISSYASDSLLHGSYGNVSQVLWSNGTTMTINPSVNPSVRAAVYKSGSSNTGTSNVLVAYARFGLGKVVAFGDSSPFDDGSGDPNDQLYDGYITDAAGNHQKLIMNATVWLATTTSLPVELVSFNCSAETNTGILKWTTATETNTSHFNIQRSFNGRDFLTIDEVKAKGSSAYTYTDYSLSTFLNQTFVYYRLEILDNNGAKTYSQIEYLNLKNRNNQQIKIYPNPASSIAIIDCSGVRELKIFNSLGMLILSSEITATPFLFNTNKYPKGLYLVQAKFNNGNFVSSQIVVE